MSSSPSGQGKARPLLIAGNYCHDTLVDAEGRTSHTLGGSVGYMGAVLPALGADLRIVANAGPDFRYGPQVGARFAPRIRPGFATTAFLARHEGDQLAQFVENPGTPIPPEDIRAAAAAVRRENSAVPSTQPPFAIALACGVAGELSPETIVEMAISSDILCADAQGLLRVIGVGGRVGHRPLAGTAFASVANRIRVLKASREESRFIDLDAFLADPARVVIITEGRHGCRLRQEGRETALPAIPVQEIDPTGAGDSFLAGLAFGLSRGRTLIESARLGNVCGAFAVTALGVPDFATGFLAWAHAHDAEAVAWI